MSSCTKFQFLWSILPFNNFSDPIDIDLEGEFFWERVYYIDNRNNSEPFKETIKITSSTKTSYSDMSKSVVETAMKMGMSMDIGGAFEIITASVKTSMDLSLTSTYEHTIEEKTESEVTEEFTQEFAVGANSLGEMFRLVYKGPGVTHASRTVSTDGALPLDKVIINTRVKPIPMFCGFDIVRSDNNSPIGPPEGVIKETFGGNPDINDDAHTHPYGQDYVYLVPRYGCSKVNRI